MTALNSHAHSHAPALGSTTAQRVLLALGITLAFVVFEAGAGIYANSLALLTDAAHNVTDVVALALSWYALRVALRPANASKTYGYHRVGIIVALVNALSLILISLFIIYEAIERIMHPLAVQDAVLIGVALIAFFVNGVTALLVLRGSKSDLNQRSAFLHLAGDTLATLGAFAAGIGIALTGWDWLDPLASILIAILILWNVVGIVRESLEILLEGAPRDVDMDAMVSAINTIPGVRGVHDLHVWSLAQNLRALSAHILTDDMSISEGARVQRDINALLHEKFGIAHATLQLECVGCEPDALYCEINHSHEHNPVHPKGIQRERA
ncbi:MAG TPA: cation diffusion facilitator family transporter [Anaerolineae bacterium]|nr:cation diffusion facilitator family transporter [Anaerolineae bacterium]